MAREVLRAAGDPDLLQPVREGDDVTSDEVGLVTEGANPDHRVQRIRVDVGDRSQLEVEPDSGEISAQGTAHRPRQLDVVDRAERVGAGVRAAFGELEPGDVTALLVETDQEVRVLRAERGGQATRRPLVADVAREEHDPAQPGRCLAENPVGRLETVKARKQARGREPFELGAHPPLTAPAVSPKAIRRWTMRKKMTTGIAVSVEAAISPPQSVALLVP